MTHRRSWPVLGMVAAAAAWLAATLAGDLAHAATVQLQAVVVATCGSSPTYTAGSITYVVMDTHGQLCGTGGGGGGGGGAVTVADGADVTQGTTTDAACGTDNGTCTMEAMVKRVAQRITTLDGHLTGSTLNVTGIGTFNTNDQGNVASGSSDNGNPIKIGCVYASSPPTVTTGQRVDCAANTHGAQLVDGSAVTQPVSAASGSYVSGAIADGAEVTIGTKADAATCATTNTLIACARQLHADMIAATPAGSAIIGKVGIDQTTDVTTNGVEIAPTSATAAGITGIVSGAAEGSHVLKASAGNLYSAYVTTGATAGYFMIFNATSAPADGAVTPVQCIQAPANTTVGVSFSPGPAEVYSTGITAVFSTTGCFTKTISATAFIHGSIK